MVKILFSCKGSYSKNCSMGLLPCMHGCVHVDEGRCKLDLEKL